MAEVRTMRRARQIRVEKGMTQAEVAQKLGLLPSRIADFETCRASLPGEKLLDLAELLDANPRDLLKEIPRPDTLPRHRTHPKTGGRPSAARSA